MLFSFLTSLVDNYSFLNVFKYLTFRTGLSLMTSTVNCIFNWESFNKIIFLKIKLLVQ